MKKMIILVGMVAMLFCGCGRDNHVKAEKVNTIDTTIEQCNELAEDTISEMTDLYTRALEEIYGEDLEVKAYKFDDEGVMINGRFVSWEYVEEVAYNLMLNEDL